MSGFYYDSPDGFKTARQVSDAVFSLPFAKFGDTRTYTYKIRFSQLRTAYRQLAIDSRGPEGGRLVEETDFEDIGGGLMEWARVYALLPITHYEPESYVWNLQYKTITDGNPGIVELPLTVSSIVQYDYFWAPSGVKDITLAKATRLVQLGNSVYVTPPGAEWPLKPNSNGYIIAENSTLKRWMGNYYERATRGVEFASIGVLP